MAETGMLVGVCLVVLFASIGCAATVFILVNGVWQWVVSRRVIDRNRWVIERIDGELEGMCSFCQHEPKVVATAQRIRAVMRAASENRLVGTSFTDWQAVYCPLPTNGQREPIYQ